MDQRPRLLWIFTGVLALLCAVLAVLQYRWTGQLSELERQRLQSGLQSRMRLLSQTFNDDISRAVTTLMPSSNAEENLGVVAAYDARASRWKDSHSPLFRRVGLIILGQAPARLLLLDPEQGRYVESEWPKEWEAVRDRMRQGPFFGPPNYDDPALLEVPRFNRSPRDGGPSDQERLLFEFDMNYVRTTYLPELTARYLNAGEGNVYQAEVVAGPNGSHVIYSSSGKPITNPDATVNLLELSLRRGGFRGGPPRGGRFRPPFGFGGPPGGPGGFRPGPSEHEGRRGDGGGPGGPPPDRDERPGEPGGPPGRWRMLVRYESGMDALVSQARWRNIGVSASILVLILATASLMALNSRRAQQLAESQMNFVAGVSHELRTPLTVIRTAAYNLRGKVASRPDQVERYGKLIQDESERLGALVEQVLRYGSAKAGYVIEQREPVSVAPLIDASVASSVASAEGSGFVVEKQIAPDLPPIYAEEAALKHAIQNLIDNAAKHGAGETRWIGIRASSAQDAKGSWIEICVADRGPGIPADEQHRIFEPFYRGRNALSSQTRGTGLGLNLTKKIVEAHGGEIRMTSKPGAGAEFLVRLPAALEWKDEPANSLG